MTAENNQDMFQECTNKQGEVRLGMVKNIIDFDDTDNLEFLKTLYKEWVQHDEYLVLKKTEEMENFYKGEWVALKCSKRGNDVYQARIEKSLKEKLKHLHFKINKARGIQKTNALYLTNTYDIKLKPKSKAWLDIGKEWNLFLSNLKKEFGSLKQLRSWESFENGYPHIHTVVVFEEKVFETFRMWSEERKKYLWRIKSCYNKKIHSFWHSFVDVQGVVDIDEAIKNVVWYVLKEENKKEQRDYKDVENWGKKDLLTTISTWFFRKRSFSVSGGFADLITDVCTIQTERAAQSTLEGKKATVKYTLLGLIPGDKAKIDSPTWCKVYQKAPDWIDLVRMPKVSSQGITHDWNDN